MKIMSRASMLMVAILVMPLLSVFLPLEFFKDGGAMVECK